MCVENLLILYMCTITLYTFLASRIKLFHSLKVQSGEQKESTCTNHSQMFNANDSLRSKRFQSSYSAKFGAGAKKNGRGRGKGGEVPSLPSPSPFIPFFALVPVFSTNSRGTACYAGYANDDERYNVT